MIREKDQISFIRNYLVSSDIDFFLGSGASFAAGIPSGQSLVWQFKKEIYCTENNVAKELFKDLQSEKTRRTLQEYFDSKNEFPPNGSSEEYSYYFEKCYDNTQARKNYIQKIVSNISPIRGHLCLANLVLNNRVKNIWTTNFDELIEAGIKALAPEYSFNMLSSMQDNSLSETANNNLVNVIKLHGDYRYDKIKNTTQELQVLENNLSKLFEQNLMNRGLIVVGYSGNDESIMKVLESNIDNTDFLSKGIFWCKPKNTHLSERAQTFMNKACEINELSCVINIDSFNDFLGLIYLNSEHKNLIIDDRWKDFENRKKEICFSQNQLANTPLKTNLFVSTELPNCNVFETDITSWKELKIVIGQKKIIAGLFNGKIYSFCEETELRSVFGEHIKSDINLELPTQKELNKPHFVYTGLLYELIKMFMLSKTNISECGRNKYFFADTEETYRVNSFYTYKKYFAFEIRLSYFNEQFYLSFVPTVHLTKTNGEKIDKLHKQNAINSIMSKVYNKEYSELLKKLNEAFWIKDSKAIVFSYDKFILKFNYICLSYKMTTDSSFPQVSSFKYNEPQMIFDVNNNEAKSINQLNGLIKYAPMACGIEIL